MNMSRVIADKLASELKEQEEGLRELKSARVHLALADSTTDAKLVADIIRHQKEEMQSKRAMLEAAKKDAERIDEVLRRAIE